MRKDETLVAIRLPQTLEHHFDANAGTKVRDTRRERTAVRQPLTIAPSRGRRASPIDIAKERCHGERAIIKESAADFIPTL
jgi:hypothetical protein